MQDFFDENKLIEALHEGDTKEKTEEVKPETEKTEEPAKIKVGEKEFSQDELSQLVGLGEIARKVESEYKTDISKVWPEYTKSQNRLKELERELEETKKRLPIDQTLTEDEKSLAVQRLKELGFIQKNDLEQSEFVKREDFRQLHTLERETDKLLDECEDLEGEIDGKDGRPAFRKIDVLRYMQETGIKSPEKAYKMKYETELSAWSQSELAKLKKPGLTTSTTPSAAESKMPEEVKPNKSNLTSLLSEVLNGTPE